MITEIEVAAPNAELVVLQDNQVIEAFKKEGGVKALFEEVAKQARSIVPDMTTTKGRDAIKSLAAKVARSKTLVDGTGKKLGADAKAIVDAINADRKYFWDESEKLQIEIRKPVTDWENKEKLRILNHQTALSLIVNLPANLPLHTTSAELYELNIKRIDVEIGDSWDEFKDAAIKATSESLSTLRGLLDERNRLDLAEAELIRLRAEKAAEEKAANDKRIADAATAAAEAKAQKVIDDLQKQNDALLEEKIAPKVVNVAISTVGIKVRPNSAAQVVAADPPAFEAATPAAKGLTADQERQKEVNRAILACFTSIGVSDEHGRNIVRAIARGLVPNVTITY